MKSNHRASPFSKRSKKPRAVFNDHYDLYHTLGKGRNCTVKYGKRKSDGCSVAVKVLNRSITGSQGSIESMVNVEIAVLKRVKEQFGGHSNIVSMIAVYDEEEMIYIVLELLEGGELFDQVLARGFYSEKDASKLIKTIVLAVQALHSIHIIHRDLKPENLVFSSRGDDAELKVIDFGHSKFDCSTTKSTAQLPEAPTGRRKPGIVGTSAYVAPEVISDRLYTTSCDVWSIGVIMYILLCGYPPFYSHSNDRLLKKVVKGKFEFHKEHWDSISLEAKGLLKRMLCVNSLKRITVSEILEHSWIAKNNMTKQLSDTIKRLESFNAKRKLRAAAMACIWGARFGRRIELSTLVHQKKFSSAEMYQISCVFKQHSSDGLISLKQFDLTMASLGLNKNMPLHRMFELFDKDGNDQIDYKEFLLGLGTLRGGDDLATLKFCFDLFDADNSGCISRDELAGMFRHVACEHSGADDRAENVSLLFEKLDTDGDGKISFKEFQVGVKSTPELLSAFTKPIKRRVSISSARVELQSEKRYAVESTKVPDLRNTTEIPPRAQAPSPRPVLQLSPSVSPSELLADPAYDLRQIKHYDQINNK